MPHASCPPKQKNKFLTAKILLVFSLAVFLFAPVFVLAQQFGLEYGTSLVLGTQDIRVTVFKIIQIVLGFVGIVFLILIIYAGFLWMTSGGEQDRVDKAKKLLRNAIIGLAIILLSFAIVSYILRVLTGSWRGGPGWPGQQQPGPGYSALGGGIIESHYPKRGQKEVPRNTKIVVTFKEAINAATLISDDSGNGFYGDCNANAVCDTLAEGSVKIYPSQARDLETAAVPDDGVVVMVSGNHKTFTFRPKQYLGSATEAIYYTVALNKTIQKETGEPAFSSRVIGDYGYWWEFEVSTEIDLAPPAVASVFPFPDNNADTYDTQIALAAGGTVTVNGVPVIRREARIVSTTTEAGANQAAASGEYTGLSNDTVTITIAEGEDTADVSWTNQRTNNNSTAQILGRNISLNGGLSLRIDGDLTGIGTDTGFGDTAHEWEVRVEAFQAADTLTIASRAFTFVDSASPAAYEIALGETDAQTAGNIVQSLNRVDLPLTAVIGSGVNSNRVSLTAKKAGQEGDDIRLATSALTSVISLSGSSLTGGVNPVFDRVVHDRPDQPRNAIVQINFNEAVDPTTAIGITEVAEDGALAADTFQIATVQYDYDNSGAFDNDEYVAGEWVISNEYKTVEFLADGDCGIADNVNACGDPIFCLPMNNTCSPDTGCTEEATRFLVTIAAGLLPNCEDNDGNCLDSQYGNCNLYLDLDGGDNDVYVCQDNKSVNFAQAVFEDMEGMVDMANNSFDGNKNGQAEGPQAQSGQEPYYENQPDAAAQGDDYEWSFYISSEVDLTPPKITATRPAHQSGNFSLRGENLEMQFDKLLMSSSLKPGAGYGDDHEYITLVDLSVEPVGFSVGKIDFDTDNPPDGYADLTAAVVSHSDFAKSSNYNMRVGSGVKDIYQNCYLPSAGPNCLDTLSRSEPSCCYDGATGEPCAGICNLDGSCPPDSE